MKILLIPSEQVSHTGTSLQGDEVLEKRLGIESLISGGCLITSDMTIYGNGKEAYTEKWILSIYRKIFIEVHHSKWKMVPLVERT